MAPEQFSAFIRAETEKWSDRHPPLRSEGGVILRWLKEIAGTDGLLLPLAHDPPGSSPSSAHCASSRRFYR